MSPALMAGFVGSSRVVRAWRDPRDWGFEPRMAYRLKLGQALDDGIRRIAIGQIDRAVLHIEASVGDAPVIAVHEGRKCLKRTRALLRFARPLLAAADYRHANGVLRDVGRALSGPRDLDVVGQTIAALKIDGSLKPATVARLQRVLDTARRDGLVAPVTGDGRHGLVAQLTELRVAITGFAIAADDRKLATEGLTDCLDDCRTAFQRAFADDHDEAFHDWRKSVQLHWRHMQLVERAWPAYCRARIEEARAISMLIGTDRDLAMLATFATEHALPMTTQRDIAALLELRRPMLRAQARARGERLLAEGATGLGRRLERYWSAARRLKSAARTAKSGGTEPTAPDGT